MTVSQRSAASIATDWAGVSCLCYPWCCFYLYLTKSSVLFISPLCLIYAPINKWFMLMWVSCSHYRFLHHSCLALRNGLEASLFYTIYPHCAATSTCLHVRLPCLSPSRATSFSHRLSSPGRTSLGGLFRLQTRARGWQAVQISSEGKAEHTDWLCRAGGFAHRHTHTHTRVVVFRYLKWETFWRACTKRKATCCLVVMTFSSGVIKCRSWCCHKALSTISFASEDAVGEGDK